MDKRKTISAKNLPVSRQFGKPGGNKQCPTGIAGKIAYENRLFYKMFSEMTEKQIKEYIKNESNPYRWRLFAKRFIDEGTIKDDFELTNQICGKPKEVVEFLDSRINKDDFLKETEDFPDKDDRI